MSDQRLRELLIRGEGLRLKPYRCSADRLTIGVGRNLDDNGISKLEAMFLLTNDIERVSNLAAMNLFWFKSLSVPRQDVVLSMIFNLGYSGFLGFKKFIAALERGDYDDAAREMLDSKWAKQVGRRANELAYLMRTEIYPS